MKRLQYPILCSGVFSLLFLTLFVFQTRTHADSNPDARLERKVSKEILKKVAEGRGGDFVRVIIQPAIASDTSIDSTIEYSGGSNLRKFRNFAVRVATLPAQAAANLASRSDVAYVSLNRDVRPMGHLSRTTGTDQTRSIGSGSSLDGTGIGIAIIDSGIDTDHNSFLNKSNGVRVVYSEDFTTEGSHRRSIRTRNSRRFARGRQRSHLKR